MAHNTQGEQEKKKEPSIIIHEGDPKRRRIARDELQRSMWRNHIRRGLKRGEVLDPAYVHHLWVTDREFVEQLQNEGLIERW